MGDRRAEGGVPSRCEPQLSIPEPHIDSFNYFLEKGLKLAVQDLQPVEIDFPDLKSHIRIWFDSVTINYPCRGGYGDKVFPSEVSNGPGM